MYISNGPPGLTFDALKDLAKLSAAYRQRDGLTGVLVNLDDAYFGLLEGEEDKVIQAIKRLESSSFHSGMIVMSRRYTFDLAYSDWSVGCRSRPPSYESPLFFDTPNARSVLDRSIVPPDLEFDVFLHTFFQSNTRYSS